MLFVLTFARFEYAMKATGHAEKGGFGYLSKRGAFEPSWNRLKEVVGPKIGALDAVRYLTKENPPLVQIGPGEEDWAVIEFRDDSSEGAVAIAAVRCIRNNVVHGSKNAGA